MDPEHRCQWRDEVEKLRLELAERDQISTTLMTRVQEIEHKLALMMKQVVGPKTERMPTPEEEAKKREGEPPTRGGNVNPKKRKENAEAMASLPTTTVLHPIPDNERQCPHCGEDVQPIGDGDVSYDWEWVPGRMVRRKHVVEVGRCRCKQHYARGPTPVRVQERCTYGPAFLAKLAVDKCADATPIYRIEKAMRRAGIPISRSTMNDLVLLAADVCEPLWRALLAEVRVDPHVQADETSFRTQTRPARSFVWTFLSDEIIAYRFAPDRSGETPLAVLGDEAASTALSRVQPILDRSGIAYQAVRCVADTGATSRGRARRAAAQVQLLLPDDPDLLLVSPGPSRAHSLLRCLAEQRPVDLLVVPALSCALPATVQRAGLS